jgi:tetratricopeptide (TPR) repeat protein
MYLHAIMLLAVLSVDSDYPQLLQRARGEYNDGHYAQAEKLYLSALGTLARDDDASRALTLSELGDVYVSEDETFKSENAYAESLEIYKRLSDKKNTALLMRNLGTTYAFEGRDDEAMRLLQQSLKLANSVPNNDLLLTQIFNSLGIVCFWQGKNGKAEDFFSKALLLVSTSGIPFDLSELLNNLGAVYTIDRKFEKAEQILQRALKIKEDLAGPLHPDLTSTLDGLGMLYANTGRYAEAENQYLRALKILEPAGRNFEVRIVRVLHALSNTYTRAGRKSEADAALSRAATLARRNLGRHPEMVTVLEDYSTVLKKQGKGKEAEELRVEARRARVSSSLVINAHSPQ